MQLQFDHRIEQIVRRLSSNFSKPFANHLNTGYLTAWNMNNSIWKKKKRKLLKSHLVCYNALVNRQASVVYISINCAIIPFEWTMLNRKPLFKFLNKEFSFMLNAPWFFICDQSTTIVKYHKEMHVSRLFMDELDGLR